MPEVAKQVHPKLYPDVVAAGNLSEALGQALPALRSAIQVIDIGFIVLARVEAGSRFCQTMIAAHERLFMLDFWNQGVCYGKGSCDSLSDAAQAIHFWISEAPNVAEMQKRFSFFMPYEAAMAHESGQAVEHQWESLVERWTRNEKRYGEASSPLRLIEAAHKRPELRQLFPFTSMSSLHFSRTTGYPFTRDCPFAIPIGNNRFRAHTATGLAAAGEVIGEGTAEEVAAILVANLPPNCGPAVAGTADDLVDEKQ